MKRYFDFTLKGAELFPFWILYWVFVIVPRDGFTIYKRFFTNDHYPLVIALVGVGGFLLILAAMIILYYYINRIYVTHVRFDKDPLKFNAKFSTYLEAIVPGVILTIITFSFYLPWLVRDFIGYFVDNSSLKSKNLKFLGEGKVLFGIYMLLIVPVILTDVFLALWTGMPFDQAVKHWLPLIVQFVFMIPVSYLFYKWQINIQYKDYHIYLTSKFWSSLWKILVELFFSVITLGIYIPMMYIQLYDYFVSRTVAESKEQNQYFSFEKDNLNDYLMLWGQILLSVITLGIYTPWAIAKVGKAFLSRTYLTDSNED